MYTIAIAIGSPEYSIKAKQNNGKQYITPL